MAQLSLFNIYLSILRQHQSKPSCCG